MTTVGTAPSSSRAATRPGAGGRSLWREGLLLLTLLAAYNAGRLLAAQNVSGAFGHAARLLDLERWLGLPHEQSVQSVLLDVPDLVRFANGYYAGVHFPLTAAVLGWLFLRRPTAYLWARRSLVSATAVGLVLEIAIPVAPPRMLNNLGFVDTGLAYGQSVYGPVGNNKLANQFAALPSLHVGWAVLLAVVCISVTTSKWRWLWVLHPVVTVLVVVGTGNHYWVDGIVGGLLVTVALFVLRPGRRRPEPSPLPATAG